MLRRRRQREPEPPAPVDPVAHLDPRAVPARLVPVVGEAVQARGRWLALVGTLRPGPLRDRLGELGARIDAGVLEVYGTAVRIGEVEHVLGALDVREATAAYKAAKRRAAQGAPPPEMDALEARFASVQRMLNVVADAEERLRVLDARLDAAVARGAEVAVTADAGSITSLDADLADVVAELGALRGAMSSLA